MTKGLTLSCFSWVSSSLTVTVRTLPGTWRPPRAYGNPYGTAGLGSPSPVGGRKRKSMSGVWSWHLLARVSRCQERRGQEVPSCTTRVENSDAIPETTCTWTSAQASGPEPHSWLWTAMKIAGSWQYFRVKRAEGSSWLPPRHRQ